MKTRNFEIIEDRGCNISYSVFWGTEKECAKWLADNCELWHNQYISLDGDNINGNGEPFTYYSHFIGEFDRKEIVKELIPPISEIRKRRKPRIAKKVS